MAILFFIFQFALTHSETIWLGSLALAQDTVTEQARELKDEGNRFLKEKKYYEAIEKFKEAVRINPNYFAAYNNMGNAYHGLKQYSNALPNYQKAVELRPDIALVQSNLGNCYVNLNRYEKGITILIKAVNLEKNNAGIYENLASAYDKMGDGYYVIEFTKKAKKLYRSQGNMKMVSKVGKRLRHFYNKYGDNPKPKTVSGQAETPRQDEEGSAGGTGTGFLLGSSKYILTNHHVIDGANAIYVNFLGGERIRAKVMAQDSKNDIAVLKLAKRAGSASENIFLGDSGKAEMGEKVFTIGYPVSDVLGRNPKFSEGTISSLTGMADDPSMFQITVPIQPGNSGGPLFNMNGEVIGITTGSWAITASLNRTGTLPQNVNYAVKSNYISATLDTVPNLSVSKLGIIPVPVLPKNDLPEFIKTVKNNIVLIEASVDNSLPEFVEENDGPLQETSANSGSDLKERIRLAKERQEVIEKRFKTLEEMEALEESIFSVNEKRKEVERFLKDFPDHNPKLEEAQRMLSRLEEGRTEESRFVPFTGPQTR